jgi:hypothetical protein
MKSHSCRKTRGEGAPSTIPLTSDPVAATPTDLAPSFDVAPSPDLASTPDLTPTEWKTQTEAGESPQCHHIDAQGRQCRMLVMRPEETLCAHHAQRRNQRVSEAAQELLAAGTDFGDGAAVNRFLGALVRQVTLKRIPRRDAITLAYICQLLLNSLGAIHREESLRLEESRIQAINAAKRPPRILWDIPGPAYEPTAEEVYERDRQRDQLLYERDSAPMANSQRRNQE